MSTEFWGSPLPLLVSREAAGAADGVVVRDSLAAAVVHLRAGPAPVTRAVRRVARRQCGAGGVAGARGFLTPGEAPRTQARTKSGCPSRQRRSRVARRTTMGSTGRAVLRSVVRPPIRRP